MPRSSGLAGSGGLRSRARRIGGQSALKRGEGPRYERAVGTGNSRHADLTARPRRTTTIPRTQVRDSRRRSPKGLCKRASFDPAALAELATISGRTVSHIPDSRQHAKPATALHTARTILRRIQRPHAADSALSLTVWRTAAERPTRTGGRNGAQALEFILHPVSSAWPREAMAAGSHGRGKPWPREAMAARRSDTRSGISPRIPQGTLAAPSNRIYRRRFRRARTRGIR
jgi:hypothetical protein